MPTTMVEKTSGAMIDLIRFEEYVPEKIDRVAPLGAQPADECADDQPDHDLGR